MQTLTCPLSTIETLGKGVKYVPNKDTRTTSLMYVFQPLFDLVCIYSTYFMPFSSISIVDFEQENVCRIIGCNIQNRTLWCLKDLFLLELL